MVAAMAGILGILETVAVVTTATAGIAAIVETVAMAAVAMAIDPTRVLINLDPTTIKGSKGYDLRCF
jgi:hypothetical protein